MTRDEHRPPYALDCVACLFSAVVLVAVPFIQRGDNPYLRAASLPVFAAAAVFMFLPFRLLKKHGQVEQGKSYMHTTVVVERGLYSIVRHPQYLGYMFLMVGFGLISQHSMILVLGGLAIVCFYLYAIAEERFCRQKLGEQYEQYLHRVPRFNCVLGIIRRRISHE